jgi:hypothetical protein
MCTSLACRKSSTETNCTLIYGKSAAPGTTCASGRVNKNNFIHIFWV